MKINGKYFLGEKCLLLYVHKGNQSVRNVSQTSELVYDGLQLLQYQPCLSHIISAQITTSTVKQALNNGNNFWW